MIKSGGEKMIWKKVGMSWNPQEQKEIIGKLLSTQENGGKYKTKVYTIETENAIIDIYGSAVLDAKIKPICQIGNMIKIVFLGMKKSKDAEYKDYACYMGAK